MNSNNEVQLAIRSGQSSFNRRGYSKEDSYKFASDIVNEVLSDLSNFEDAYKETDLIELIHKVAEDVAKEMTK